MDIRFEKYTQQMHIIDLDNIQWIMQKRKDAHRYERYPLDQKELNLLLRIVNKPHHFTTDIYMRTKK